MKRRGFSQSDQIRLNLQWLDRAERLHPSNMHRIIAEVPLLLPAVALILGIRFAAGLAPETVGRQLLVIVPIAALLLAAGFAGVSPKRKLLLTAAAVLLLFACLGAARSAAIRYRPPRHISRILVEERQLATLRGRIVSPVRNNETGSDFSSIPWLGSQSSFYLSVEAVRTPPGWETICGRVRVQVNEPLRDIEAGNRVQLYCTLSRFSPPPNPGQFDLRQFMNDRGVFVAASAPVAESIRVLEPNRSPAARLRRRLYRYSADALLDETAGDPDVRALVSALLLGRRGQLDPTITAAFQQTNLAHFISLSGMHVGILAGSLWVLLRTAQIPKRPRAVLCIILILLYALIVPPRAPTMRAVFLSCFFFASALLSRRVNPLNTLALTATVLLLIRPYELFTPGWQLSFLSVLGILLFYQSVRFRILNHVVYPLFEWAGYRFARLQNLLLGAVELLAVGISAWIVIAPVLLYYFGRINPLSPLWTVLVFPVVLLILYAGFLKIALSAILPTVATFLGALLNLLAGLLEKMVMLLARVDFLQIASHRPSPVLIVLLYLLLATALLMPWRYDRARRLTLAALVGCFLLPWMTRLDGGEGGLEMTCLSVGHGQGVVVSTPAGEHLLFDAGSITHQDIARKIIAPYLQHKRIFSLDAVYISHGDLDHLNAIPDIAAGMKPETVYGNPVFLANTLQPSLEQTLRTRLAELGCDPVPVADGQYGPVRVRSLWPLTDVTDAALSENDRSQVLLLEYAGRKLLLCGDIERAAQQAFCARYPGLTVDVMLLPHHGSTTNLDTQFIDRLSPAVLIASCARRNQPNAYRPPAEARAHCFYTATDGAVTIKIKPDGTLSANGFLNAAQTNHE